MTAHDCTDHIKRPFSFDNYHETRNINTSPPCCSTQATIVDRYSIIPHTQHTYRISAKTTWQLWNVPTHIDRSYCGGNFKWRFVGKYSCSFTVSILNHFLWTWKPTITTSFTSCHLVTSYIVYEILVVTLATRKAQFRTLVFYLASFHQDVWGQS